MQTFLYCSRLETVALPSTLTEIGYQAFEVCTNLTYLKLPENVKHFRHACFGACRKLELHLPAETKMPDDVVHLTSLGYEKLKSSDIDFFKKITLYIKSGVKSLRFLL